MDCWLFPAQLTIVPLSIAKAWAEELLATKAAEATGTDPSWVADELPTQERCRIWVQSGPHSLHSDQLDHRPAAIEFYTKRQRALELTLNIDEDVTQVDIPKVKYFHQKGSMWFYFINGDGHA